MKSAVFALGLAIVAPAAATGPPAGHLREVRFTGPSAMDALCACLLDARRSAETQGRLDFTAEVELAGTDAANSEVGSETGEGVAMAWRAPA